jgi:hypothetical protein
MYVLAHQQAAQPSLLGPLAALSIVALLLLLAARMLRALLALLAGMCLAAVMIRVAEPSSSVAVAIAHHSPVFIGLVIATILAAIARLILGRPRPRIRRYNGGGDGTDSPGDSGPY